MEISSSRERVDSLIDHFWKNGYLTVSRKFGTYLPEPNNIGKYSVDAIGKQRKKYVLGIVLTQEDLKDKRLLSRLTYLATRHTKYSQKRVTLFIGVPKKILKDVRDIINDLPEDAKQNIKIVGIREENIN